jgi:hypothetical protein
MCFDAVSLIRPSFPLPFPFIFSFLFLISSQSHQQITTRFTRFISHKSPHNSQLYSYKNQHSNHSHEFNNHNKKSPQQSHVLHKINIKMTTSSRNHQIEPPGLHPGPTASDCARPPALRSCAGALPPALRPRATRLHATRPIPPGPARIMREM